MFGKDVVVSIVDIQPAPDRMDDNLTLQVSLGIHWEVSVDSHEYLDPVFSYHKALVIAAWLHHRPLRYTSDVEGDDGGTLFQLQGISPGEPVDVDGEIDIGRVIWAVNFMCEIQYLEGVYNITPSTREGPQVTLPVTEVTVTTDVEDISQGREVIWP